MPGLSSTQRRQDADRVHWSRPSWLADAADDHRWLLLTTVMAVVVAAGQPAAGDPERVALSQAC